jgi:hypothetical protein
MMLGKRMPYAKFFMMSEHNGVHQVFVLNFDFHFQGWQAAKNRSLSKLGLNSENS